MKIYTLNDMIGIGTYTNNICCNMDNSYGDQKLNSVYIPVEEFPIVLSKNGCPIVHIILCHMHVPWAIYNLHKLFSILVNLKGLH